MQKLILNRQKYIDWMFGGKSDMIQLADTVIEKLKEQSDISLEDILNDSIDNTDYLPFHVIENINDIDKEIKAITQRLSKAVETPSQKFEPIPIDKADGLYATVNYTHLTDINNIKLEENPSVTPEDILEIKKEYSKYNDNRPEISILLTNDGARKFYLLTKR